MKVAVISSFFFFQLVMLKNSVDIKELTKEFIFNLTESYRNVWQWCILIKSFKNTLMKPIVSRLPFVRM
jgi:hypothetical protein